MLYKDYQKAVSDLSDTVVSMFLDDPSLDLDQIIHETIDSCEYVIYTRQSWDLVMFTRFNVTNEFFDACEDVVENGQKTDSEMRSLAYQILVNAVRVELSDLVGC